MSLVNPFTQPGKWFKANLHTHTTASDGTQTLAQQVEAYRKAGYHILAITDHNITTDVHGLGSAGFLVIGGMEFHPACPATTDPHHIVALNVPHGFSLTGKYPQDANGCILAVKEAGGECILAHPFWCGHTYEMYRYLTGYVAVEVYNATCDRMARGESETDWCHLLDDGRMIPAVAVDDCHVDEDLYDGFTMFRMPKLTVECFLEALRTGSFYSSTGPTIRDFRVVGNKVIVRSSPAAKIYLDAQIWHGARKRAAEGKHITQFACKIDPTWQYVRAVVVDDRGRKAWANPIALKPVPPRQRPTE